MAASSAPKKTKKSTRQAASKATDDGSASAPAAAPANQTKGAGTKKAGKSVSGISKAVASASATGAKKSNKASKAAAKKNAKQTLSIGPALTSDLPPRTTRSRPVFQPVALPSIDPALAFVDLESDQPGSDTEPQVQDPPSAVRTLTSVTNPSVSEVSTQAPSVQDVTAS
ncbi:hypothetical protein QFC20_007047 [Naganishia adeliensis]|uniref:Uncharacterized protein n=1 Tax=Naganishia adeliensis TaxID=92952 RepID=A0ACC2V4K9_9TREE|nr:hypothetical protein QFC20_007047 [Naganishia adeliensis]